MVEDIKLDVFPKEAGVYLFRTNEEVIYVGSSKKLYQRMAQHISSIRKGGDHGHQQDFYKFLQSNQFTVEFQLTDNYRQLEQKLIEQHHPIYNSRRANTGLCAYKGRETEYNKEWYQKYKEEVSEQAKQYYESKKEQIKQKNNQLCLYEGQTMTLCALSSRFKRQGIDHPTLEVKKYIIKKESNNAIEFYDIYP